MRATLFEWVGGFASFEVSEPGVLAFSEITFVVQVVALGCTEGFGGLRVSLSGEAASVLFGDRETHWCCVMLSCVCN